MPNSHLSPGVQNQHGQHSNLDQSKGLTKNEQSDKIKEENSENQKKKFSSKTQYFFFCAMNVLGKVGKETQFLYSQGYIFKFYRKHYDWCWHTKHTLGIPNQHCTGDPSKKSSRNLGARFQSYKTVHRDTWEDSTLKKN